jgi:hypothetical protein
LENPARKSKQDFGKPERTYHCVRRIGVNLHQVEGSAVLLDGVAY